MAIKFEKIREGDILYDWHKTQMGNTTMRAMGCWSVQIMELLENGARVSWNGNPSRIWYRSQLEKLHRAKYQKKTV
jgi:hypothetical protein